MELCEMEESFSLGKVYGQISIFSGVWEKKKKNSLKDLCISSANAYSVLASITATATAQQSLSAAILPNLSAENMPRVREIEDEETLSGFEANRSGVCQEVLSEGPEI